MCRCVVLAKPIYRTCLSGIFLSIRTPLWVGWIGSKLSQFSYLILYSKNKTTSFNFHESPPKYHELYFLYGSMPQCYGLDLLRDTGCASNAVHVRGKGWGAPSNSHQLNRDEQIATRRGSHLRAQLEYATSYVVILCIQKKRKLPQYSLPQTQIIN